jgi:hypothetical protein
MSEYINIKSYYTFLLFISLAFPVVFLSCKKDNIETTIPNVPVNITLSLNLPEYSSLNNPGGTYQIAGGYRGIVIYRRSVSDFVAFDRACPYDPTATGAILEIDSSGVTTIDYHCGSTFSLYDGSIIHGPATISMKGYSTTYSAGSNTLYIEN